MIRFSNDPMEAVNSKMLMEQEVSRVVHQAQLQKTKDIYRKR